MLAGWVEKVQTIQIVERYGGMDVFGHPEDDTIIEMFKEAIQVNLSLEENQDVVAGEIKIWQRSSQSSTLLQVITVMRPLKE